MGMHGNPSFGLRDGFAGGVPVGSPEAAAIIARVRERMMAGSNPFRGRGSLPPTDAPDMATHKDERRAVLAERRCLANDA